MIDILGTCSHVYRGVWRASFFVSCDWLQRLRWDLFLARLFGRLLISCCIVELCFVRLHFMIAWGFLSQYKWTPSLLDAWYWILMCFSLIVSPCRLSTAQSLRYENPLYSHWLLCIIRLERKWNPSWRALPDLSWNYWNCILSEPKAKRIVWVSKWFRY